MINSISGGGGAGGGGGSACCGSLSVSASGLVLVPFRELTFWR